MDSVLGTLAHPVRRRTVELLLQHGPARQEVLRGQLEAFGGTLSKHMKELLSSGIVARETARGECRLTQTLQVLQAAADLDKAIAVERAVAASDASDRLQQMPPQGPGT